MSDNSAAIAQARYVLNFVASMCSDQQNQCGASKPVYGQFRIGYVDYRHNWLPHDAHWRGDLDFAALLVYDYLLTLSDEISLFWLPRKVNGASVSFVLSRYLTLAVQLCGNVPASQSSFKVRCLLHTHPMKLIESYTSTRGAWIIQLNMKIGDKTCSDVL